MAENRFQVTLSQNSRSLMSSSTRGLGGNPFYRPAVPSYPPIF